MRTLHDIASPDLSRGLVPAQVEAHESPARHRAGFLLYPDGMRTVAIVAVIALHTSGVRVSNSPSIETVEWWTGHVIDSLCRWCVPVFIMLSGALLLDPDRHETPFHFYRKRFSRVVIPLLV